MTDGPRVVDLRPRRTWAPPGQTIEVEVLLTAPDVAECTLSIELLDVAQPVAGASRRVRLPAGRSRRTLRIRLPEHRRAGYGLRVMLEPRTGPSSTRQTPIEAIEGWWQAPRHAAIVDHIDPVKIVAAVRGLRDWNVTVVQLYDWMYRHYRYRPPSGASFVDSLGRPVDHDAVRAGVRAGHEVGIASLAYGSVYGAEREHVDAHPDERAFDVEGRPLSLGEMFYINDIRPGRPWRARLLQEYRSTIRRLRVDGIHMDTYGPPHHAVGADGGPIDFAAEYPGLIVEASDIVRSAAPDAKVLFNCVEGFPLEAIAPAPTAALYLELWPPDVTYADVVAWVDRAAAVAAGRAVIIAAYLSVLRTFEDDPPRRAEAVEAAILLSSVIFAAGAFHHALAAEDRLLVEGYYPEARSLRPNEREALRAAWGFQARYRHLLADPGRVLGSTARLRVLDSHDRPVPLSTAPAAGSVWVRSTTTADGRSVLQLVDLLDQTDGTWDARRRSSPQRRGWRLVEVDGPAGQRWAMSPWTQRGIAAPIAAGRLPPFQRWLVMTTAPLPT